jgi:hypothetical protein
LAELQQLDAAVDQWAIEFNRKAGDRPTLAQVRQYLHKDSRLFNAFGDPAGPKDILGNPFGPFVVDTMPMVSPATAKALSEVAPREFWKGFIE